MVKERRAHENGFGDFLSDDGAELAEIRGQDLAHVEEAVRRQLGEPVEEHALRQIATQQRRHPTQQLPNNINNS